MIFSKFKIYKLKNLLSCLLMKIKFFDISNLYIYYLKCSFLLILLLYLYQMIKINEIELSKTFNLLVFDENFDSIETISFLSY